MKTRQFRKADVQKTVEKYADLMFDVFEYMRLNPELGWKEYKANERMIAEFEKLGYKVERPDGVTGFWTTIDTGKPGKTIAILGELDSVICAAHPDADPVTGAVHSCGHNMQSATLLGIAAALTNKELLEGLSGKIKLIAVPAEEGCEVGYRAGLIKAGVLSFASGKQEFIKRGVFDDVDIAYMNHTGRGTDSIVTLNLGTNGVVRKSVTFEGVASHAGGSPEKGINALYAANLALMAINSIRETFTEEEYIRIHPIITKGGDIVNTIPDDVRVESYVRGATPDFIKKANDKVNRAIAGAALSMGAKAKVVDIAGSMPRNDSLALRDVFYNVSVELFGKENVKVDDKWLPSSTDMGDVTSIMPALHGYINGAIGHGHGSDYRIPDAKGCCIKSATQQIRVMQELLKDDCALAEKVIKETKVSFKDKEEYLAFLSTLMREFETVEYVEGGAKVTL